MRGVEAREALVLLIRVCVRCAIVSAHAYGIRIRRRHHSPCQAAWQVSCYRRFPLESCTALSGLVSACLPSSISCAHFQYCGFCVTIFNILRMRVPRQQRASRVGYLLHCVFFALLPSGSSGTRLATYPYTGL